MSQAVTLIEAPDPQEIATQGDRVKKLIGRFILTENPFIGYCLVQMVIYHNAQLPTMGVSIVRGAVRLYYNAKFVKELPDDELMGVLEHEVLHVLHIHMVRGGDRDHQLFNAAADMAINPLIKHKLPASRLWPKKEWEGKSAEWIYERLEEEEQKTGKKPGDALDDHSGWGQSEADQRIQQAMAEATARSLVEQAMNKSKGHLPAGWEDAVQALLKGTVNWRSLIRYYWSRKVRLIEERSRRRRSRRLLHLPFAFPGFVKRRGMEVVIAVDTSGSITQTELGQFFGECESLMRRTQAMVRLIQCDAEVGADATYKKGDWQKIKIVGRGGTDFRPVFDKLNQEANIQTLVYFTDGMGTFPDTAPKYDVIWAGTQDFTPPFGKFVRVEIPK